MRHRTGRVCGILALVAVSIAEAQPPLLHLTSPTPYAFRGRVESLGDVDGDGYADILIGGYQSSGIATVRSGRTGAPLYSLSNGFSTVAGDVDLDGIADIIAGAGGGLELRRGTDGSLLYGFPRYQDSDPNCLCPSYFVEMRGVGDLDGDGRADQVLHFALQVTISEAFHVLEVRSGSGVRRGVIDIGWYWGGLDGGMGDVDGDGHDDFVFWRDNQSAVVTSGATLAPIVTMPAEPWPGYLVWSGVPGPDLDGDGARELLLRGQVWPSGPPFLSVHNLVTGQHLRLMEPATGFVMVWPFDAGDAGDVDGDGTPDIYVAAPSAAANAGEVRFYSGATFALLGTRTGAAFDGFGYSVAAFSDLNGDGLDDVLVEASCVAQPCSPFGYLDVVTLVTLPSAQVALAGAGCSAGSLIPALTIPSARVWAPLTATVSQAPAGADGLLAAAPGSSAATSLAPGCVLWVPYVTGFVLVPFTTDASGSWSIDVGIPGAAMAGGRLTVQAGVIDPVMSALRLTPGYEVTLEY